MLDLLARLPTTSLPGLGLAFVLVGGVWFLRHMAKGTMPPGQRFLVVTSALGALLGLAGIAHSALSGAPWGPTLGLAIPAIVLGALLLTLVRLRRVPLGDIRVAEGDSLIPFQARCPDGSVFDSDALHGRRVLLKFFRGHWCPFCSVELKMFEAMGPELRRAGIDVVALSKDTPEQAARHRERDALTMTLLSDADLRVIRKYGVEHQKALELSGPQLSLFGLPIGTRPRFEAMAAPTTLLIDESGTIRWVDQSDDYKVRASGQRVLQAVSEAFGVSLEASPASEVVVPQAESLCC